MERFALGRHFLKGGRFAVEQRRDRRADLIGCGGQDAARRQRRGGVGRFESGADVADILRRGRQLPGNNPHRVSFPPPRRVAEIASRSMSPLSAPPAWPGTAPCGPFSATIARTETFSKNLRADSSVSVTRAV